MEMRIQNGDFVPDHRGIPQVVDGVEETINRVFFCLCARRGGFALLPGLGSRLREISGSGENRDLTAAVMVREALESLDGVQVGEVSTARQGEALTISIRLQLAVGEYEIEVGVPYGQ